MSCSLLIFPTHCRGVAIRAIVGADVRINASAKAFACSGAASAEKVYFNASCPVMTVGPKVHLSADCKLRRVLCPVDLAEDPEPVLHDALALAEEDQSRVRRS